MSEKEDRREPRRSSGICLFVWMEPAGDAGTGSELQRQALRHAGLEAVTDSLSH